MLTNPQILLNISTKQERRIIGLMSGTSLDGLDIALCTFKNSGRETQVKLEKFKTVSYSQDIKAKIQQVFCKEEIKLQQLCTLNAWIGTLHGEMVSTCLEEWNVNSKDVDLIASHGQTIYHSPFSLHKIQGIPNSTLQIGDADHIAVKTGLVTISDFRQKHIAAGGEGAPLAVYGDYLIFSKKGENRIMLNIGGISNITCLYGDLDSSKVFSTDLGPGNTLIDAYMRKHFGTDCDMNGDIARAGKINQDLLSALKDHSFFTATFPKTTGPELFNLLYIETSQVSSGTLSIQPQDVVSTLTRFTAEIIAQSIQSFVEKSFQVYASGGGTHNPVLMEHLEKLLALRIKFTDELGINGDAKEAVLFATLANEAVAGGGIKFGERSTIPSVLMGKISFPG